MEFYGRASVQLTGGYWNCDVGPAQLLGGRFSPHGDATYRRPTPAVDAQPVLHLTE